MRLLIFLALLAALLWWLRQRFLANPATSRPQPPAATLSETEARDILGLDANATREDIIAAHRKLMQKVHPDVGGTTYLARQLNEAKRVLLEHR